MHSKRRCFMLSVCTLFWHQAWVYSYDLCEASQMPCVIEQARAKGDTWKSTISASKWRSNFRDNCPSS